MIVVLLTYQWNYQSFSKVATEKEQKDLKSNLPYSRFGCISYRVKLNKIKMPS